MRTSVASTLPCPLDFGISCCAMMPNSTNESCTLTCCCWWAGKTSMTLFIVWTASDVCSVENTRCPVSAISSAASIVSRSRISPMSITFGSCLRTCFSDCANDCVSLPTSRWSTSAFLFLCTYSIGSSMMTIWQFLSEFILSTIDASVVDLPLPVAPVTSTRPLGLLQRSSATLNGRPHSSKLIMCSGRSLTAAPTYPLCTKTLTLKRPSPSMPKETSSSSSRSNFSICCGLSML